MKNLKLYLAIFAMLRIATLSAQDEPINVWIPWTCQDGSELGPMPVGDRTSVIQFDTPWSQGNWLVQYSVPTMFGMTWVYWRTVGPGRHTIDFQYENPQVPGFIYQNSFPTALLFTDSAGNTLVSSMIVVTTEPAPTVENVAAVSGDQIEVLVSTPPVNGGYWGQVETCFEYPTLAIVSGSTPDGTVVFQDTIVCPPGAPTNALLSYEYEGAETVICFSTKMVRLVSQENADLQYQITTSNSSCVTVGELSTGVDMLFGEKVLVKAFPNPFTESLTITASPFAKWRITNHLGQEVMSGFGNKTIDTSAFARGVYVLFTEDGQTIRIIKG